MADRINVIRSDDGAAVSNFGVVGFAGGMVPMVPSNYGPVGFAGGVTPTVPANYASQRYPDIFRENGAPHFAEIKKRYGDIVDANTEMSLTALRTAVENDPLLAVEQKRLFFEEVEASHSYCCGAKWVYRPCISMCCNMVLIITGIAVAGVAYDTDEGILSILGYGLIAVGAALAVGQIRARCRGNQKMRYFAAIEEQFHYEPPAVNIATAGGYPQSMAMPVQVQGMAYYVNCEEIVTA
ncbi:MAG: hypothetical protein LBI69_03525 [Puniceicoccales bacterium]|jgi:hypothetical protein|nr:hypothetical protein [Puniceicoccales bacterium]